MELPKQDVTSEASPAAKTEVVEKQVEMPAASSSTEQNETKPDNKTSYKNQQPEVVLKFCEYLFKMKELKRKGWVRCNVSLPESVADHSFRMTVLAMLAPRRLDNAHCMRLAVAHDIAESVIGDITPHDGVTKEEKFKRESEAIREIAKSIPLAVHAQQLVDLWDEFETGTSGEAVFVRDLDKMEMMMQCYQYEVDRNIELPDSFFSSVCELKDPLLKKLVKAIVSERTKLKQSRAYTITDEWLKIVSDAEKEDVSAEPVAQAKKVRQKAVHRTVKMNLWTPESEEQAKTGKRTFRKHKPASEASTPKVESPKPEAPKIETQQPVKAPARPQYQKQRRRQREDNTPAEQQQQKPHRYNQRNEPVPQSEQQQQKPHRYNQRNEPVPQTEQQQQPHRYNQRNEPVPQTEQQQQQQEPRRYNQRNEPVPQSEQQQQKPHRYNQRNEPVPQSEQQQQKPHRYNQRNEPVPQAEQQPSHYQHQRHDQQQRRYDTQPQVEQPRQAPHHYEQPRRQYETQPQRYDAQPVQNERQRQFEERRQELSGKTPPPRFDDRQPRPAPRQYDAPRPVSDTRYNVPLATEPRRYDNTYYNTQRQAYPRQ